MPLFALPSRSVLALASILLGIAGPSRAACDNCPQRSTTLYDFDVTVPKPDSLADRVVWYSLFYAASAAGSAIFTPQCARFIDGSVYRDGSGVPSNSIKVGIDHPNTAPAGSLKGMDYLLNGSLSPDGSGFKVTMSLECACGRKKVISASAHFDDEDQASAAAGELARAHFVPLADKIRAYEREARDGDPEVSIGGYDSKLVMDPARRKANMGEKVPVTLTLLDCDGEPLAGRTISLAGGGKEAPPSLNGSFAVTEATTGSDGKVTVDFTVGNTRGAALARAYFFHKTPFGCEAVAVDEAAIQVEGSARYYQVRYQYEEIHDMEFQSHEEFTPTWTKDIRKTDFRKTVFSGSAVFENIANSQGGAGVELEGAGLGGGTMAGSYEQSIHATGNENFAGDGTTITSANFEDRNYRGSPVRSGSEAPDFYVNLDADDLAGSSQFSFTLPFSSQGYLIGAGYQITKAQGQVFDTSFTNSDTLSEETSYGPSIKIVNRYSLKDSVFHIDGALDTVWTAEGTKTKLYGKLSATVAPIALEAKANGILPGRDPSRRQARIRMLNGGRRITCGLADVAPGARVRVEIHSLQGSLLSVLHDAPRGPERELTLLLDPGQAKAGAGLSVIVFRAGSLRESQVLYGVDPR
jgi:hypothetical protein